LAVLDGCQPRLTRRPEKVLPIQCPDQEIRRDRLFGGDDKIGPRGVCLRPDVEIGGIGGE
jgi:hypothetical protein